MSVFMEAEPEIGSKMSESKLMVLAMAISHNKSRTSGKIDSMLAVLLE